MHVCMYIHTYITAHYSLLASSDIIYESSSLPAAANANNNAKILPKRRVSVSLMYTIIYICAHAYAHICGYRVQTGVNVCVSV